MAAASQGNQHQNIVEQHSRSARAQRDFDSRCKLLRHRLAEEDFLSNKGIGNEVGFFTFLLRPLAGTAGARILRSHRGRFASGQAALHCESGEPVRRVSAVA